MVKFFLPSTLRAFIGPGAIEKGEALDEVIVKVLKSYIVKF